MKPLSTLKPFIALLIILALIRSPGAQGLTIPQVEPVPAKEETATVIRVIDGDTLKVKYRGQKESIRLIGIDCPESRINKKALKDAKRSGPSRLGGIKTITAQGKAATQYVKSILRPGDTITLEFDVQPRDKYCRLLNYVYLDNGLMLNEEIVRAGYAELMTIPPNVKYVERLLKAYREAREKRQGLWGEN